MLGITHFPLFIAAVFLLNFTPGPDTAYIVGRSLAQGRKAGVLSALGVSTGACVHTLASAFGLTALLAASATAFSVFKIAGAVYLIYLGTRLLLTKPQPGGVATAGAATGMPRPLRAVYLQGFWTNVLNPKVMLFFVSFFPQFVSAQSDYKPLAFLVLGGIFVAMSLVWSCFVAWIAGTATQRLSGRARVRQWLERGVGSAFIGLGIKLAMTTR